VPNYEDFQDLGADLFDGLPNSAQIAAEITAYRCNGVGASSGRLVEPDWAALGFATVDPGTGKHKTETIRRKKGI